jgi:uncharacterized protein (TIGR02246 family)
VRIALALSIGLAAQPARAEDVRKAVDAGNAAFRTALLAGDAKKVSELYTTSAVVIPAGAPIASGRAAIALYWQGAIDGGVKDLALDTHAVEAAGDLAIEDGTLKLTTADGGVSSSRYVVVWKREGGGWRLHRDIWNGDK